jgi:mRNA-degrading endonuclease RelE of RelBE toxin-antitoxin system
VSYTLVFDRKFKKNIDKLSASDKERILKKVFELENFPE